MSSECARLVENYFDKLLAWNQETGWDKMIDITIWRTPIYEEGKDLREAMNQLKEILAQGKPYTSYAQIGRLLRRNQQETAAKIWTRFGDDRLHRAIQTGHDSKLKRFKTRRSEQVTDGRTGGGFRDTKLEYAVRPFILSGYRLAGRSAKLLSEYLLMTL